MTHYDHDQDSKTELNEASRMITLDTTSAIQQDLIAAEAKVTTDPVEELTFVTTLIQNLEALHKQDPEADLSLSRAGAWTASFETVLPPYDEDKVDPIAA